MNILLNPWVLSLLCVLCVVCFFYACRSAAGSVVHTHTFLDGDRVRFSPKALSGLQIADNGVHVVAEANHVCDGLIGLLNYPVELSVAGHHQRIRLDNGFVVSGAWLLPA